VGVLILHPCSQRSDQWRRSGVLTVVEAALLLYRALLSTPVWFKFFEEQNIGSILCSSCTGVHGPCLLRFSFYLDSTRRAENAAPLSCRDSSFRKSARSRSMQVALSASLIACQRAYCSSAGLYLIFKCSAVFERASSLLASTKAVLRQQFSYGKQATPDDMSEVGNQCSICQASLLRPLPSCRHSGCSLITNSHRQATLTPVLCRVGAHVKSSQAGCLQPHILQVSPLSETAVSLLLPALRKPCVYSCADAEHVVRSCSECISEWFERSVNCPICRAVAKPPGMNTYGDGSTALLPTVF